MEDILGSSARDDRAVLLEGSPHALGECGAAGGGEAALEGHGVHAGHVDGERTAPGSMADVRAIGEGVLIEDQRSTRGSGLGRSGVSGQQRHRGCGAGGTSGALGNGKVQNGALGSAGVGDLGAAARVTGGDRSYR